MAALPILSPAGETAYMLPHDGEPPSRGRVKTAPQSHAHSEVKQGAADNPRGWMRAVSDAVRRDSLIALQMYSKRGTRA